MFQQHPFLAASCLLLGLLIKYSPKIIEAVAKLIKALRK